MTTSTERLSPSAAGQVRDHLQAILTSPAFAPSRRSQDFLRFVIERTLNGQADLIKERSIATEVFGRPSDYEPGEDSIVRVKAIEVRRRLGKFYETSGAKDGIRIDLFAGSYVPRIHLPQSSGTVILADPLPSLPIPGPIASKRMSRRSLLLSAGGVATGALAFGIRSLRKDAITRLWQPVIASSEPLAIFLAILNEPAQPAIVSYRVGMGSAYGAIQVATFLTRKNHPFVVKMGPDLSFADLRRQPSFLFGAFSSSWPVELMKGKRFQLVRGSNGGPGAIVDTKTNRNLSAVGIQPNGYADEDYAIAARIFDAGNGQPIMLASGITTFGCQTAAEFLLNETAFSAALKDAPKDWDARSFQVILHTRILGHTPSAPTVVGSTFW